MKRSAILLLSGIGLMGCTASGIPEQVTISNQNLASTDICCESVAAFPWIQLQKEDDLKFNIDESSPAWNFDEGKAYFSAFEFAQESGMVEIIVRSNMLDSQVLAPQVAFYDSSFNLVNVVDKDDFAIKFSDALARNRYEISLKVDSVKTPYMVFYGNSQDIGEKVVVPHPAKVRAEESGDPLPIVTDPTYYVAPVGNLTVEYETTSLSGYKQKRQETNSSTPVVTDSKATTSEITPTNDTELFYHQAIETAVADGNLNKALALLEEAKALNVKDAQKVFVEAVNK